MFSSVCKTKAKLRCNPLSYSIKTIPVFPLNSVFMTHYAFHDLHYNNKHISKTVRVEGKIHCFSTPQIVLPSLFHGVSKGFLVLFRVVFTCSGQRRDEH